MADNYNENDIASAQSDHDIASAQSDHDIASAQSDHNLTAVSSWDDYGVTIVTEDMNRKYSDCEDMDISKSNANNSYNNILQDSLGNEIINDDNASSGYQSNNDHRSSRPYKNDVYAKRIGDRLRSAKPKVPPKSTYIPPEFEENFSSTIEAGSNFEKYDKIEVIANGIDVPQKISTFQSSGLREIILNNLKNCNYTTPTPIQKYALPIIMNDRDMIASAQTGSGKTAAYILPILNKLLDEPSKLIVDGKHCEPQVLIMSPTRELAIQICELATRLSRDTGIKCELLYGGTATYYQREKVLRGVHILVATPGRLIDFVNRRLITFFSIRYFILDEADRLLDMGFQGDIEQILCHHTMVFTAERTTLMFSATLPENVQYIAKAFLKPDYISVAVGDIGGACKDVTQTILEVKKFDKRNALLSILKETDDCQGTIVFVEEKRQADFLAAILSEYDYPTTSIHGDRLQPQREIALRDFKQKRMKILVATSVASRGLDITGVKMVVNYDLPKTIEEYVHRIGRTGRLGNIGKAISFYDPEKDYPIAFDLAIILKRADQEVPTFLFKFRSKNYKPIKPNMF
uniref:RNA helicase n=1 Tax=Sipha flava TaxID=143950 RepID=A0A2S2QYW4_9HEMI